MSICLSLKMTKVLKFKNWNLPSISTYVNKWMDVVLNHLFIFLLFCNTNCCKEYHFQKLCVIVRNNRQTFVIWWKNAINCKIKTLAISLFIFPIQHSRNKELINLCSIKFLSELSHLIVSKDYLLFISGAEVKIYLVSS